MKNMPSLIAERKSAQIEPKACNFVSPARSKTPSLHFSYILLSLNTSDCFVNCHVDTKNAGFRAVKLRIAIH